MKFSDQRTVRTNHEVIYASKDIVITVMPEEPLIDRFSSLLKLLMVVTNVYPLFDNFRRHF